MSKKDKNILLKLAKNFIIDETESEYKNIRLKTNSEKFYSYNNKNNYLNINDIEKRKRFFSDNTYYNKFVPRLRPKISNIKPTLLKLNRKTSSNSRNIREIALSNNDEKLINSYENEDTESFISDTSSSDSDSSSEEEKFIIIKEDNGKILENKVKKIKEELHECSDIESEEEELNKVRFFKPIFQIRKELIKNKVKINKNFSYKDDTSIEMGKCLILKTLDVHELFCDCNIKKNSTVNQKEQKRMSILNILENKQNINKNVN